MAEGKVGNSKTKSAIALKADAVRIVARDGIKLVTRTDAINSQGGQIAEAVGIDLLATNNDEDLQPLVKGGNLKEALEKLVTHVDKLNGIVDSLLMYQIAFNEEHNITPEGITKAVADIMEGASHAPGASKRSYRDLAKVAEEGGDYQTQLAAMNQSELTKEISKLEEKMYNHAKNLEFEEAAKTRDQVRIINENFLLS